MIEALKPFEDVIPDQLLKDLPPKISIDHKIELMPVMKRPTKPPYRIAPPELAELRKQQNELLEVGFLVPSKVSYKAPMLFKKKKD